MDRKQAIMILLIICFLTIGIASFVYLFLTTLEVREIEMDLKVIPDRFGVTVDTDKIWFGGLKPGTSSNRIIIINNEFEFPIKVIFTPSGDLAEIVSIESRIYIDPGMNQQVRIAANVPPDMPMGNYTGILTVVFKKRIGS